MAILFAHAVDVILDRLLLEAKCSCKGQTKASLLFNTMQLSL